MLFQVSMVWDECAPHPAFTDLQRAIAYAKGLMAQLPEDAHPETEVDVSDANGKVVFTYTLNAWRFAVLLVGDSAYDY